MQAMTSRRSAAAGTLKFVIAMIAKSFSLNTHSQPTRAHGMPNQWKEGQTRAPKRLWEIVKRLWEFVRLYWHTEHTYLHKIVTLRANKL
jgi:hypothetical protein